LVSPVAESALDEERGQVWSVHIHLGPDCNLGREGGRERGREGGLSVVVKGTMDVKRRMGGRVWSVHIHLGPDCNLGREGGREGGRDGKAYKLTLSGRHQGDGGEGQGGREGGREGRRTLRTCGVRKLPAMARVASSIRRLGASTWIKKEGGREGGRVGRRATKETGKTDTTTG